MTTTINLDLLNKARLRHKTADEPSSEANDNIVNIRQEDNVFSETVPTNPPILTKQSVIDAAEVKKEELRQEAEIKALQDDINKNNEEEKGKLLEAQAKIAESQRILEEKKAQTQKIDDQRKAIEAEIQSEIANKEQLNKQQENAATLQHKKDLQELEEKRKEANKARTGKWLKMILTTIFSLILIGFLLVGLYRFYRWATEEPIIVEVEKIVEKIVIKESEVAAFAPSCIKLKQDGETLFNCSGLTYRVNTLSELSKEQRAEILSAMDKKAK
ncbi:MAG: hypothetical protein MJK12_19320 [Colwellia sp.]|nr:hypothetical protein [Colwellia sp.]